VSSRNIAGFSNPTIRVLDWCARQDSNLRPKVCKNFGQRVQMSVFECRVTRAQLEDLEAKLLKIIEPDKDSLRIYTLPGGRQKCLRVHGQDRYTDFDDPLVV